MITQDQIPILKQISIADYLASRGFQPASINGKELKYLSPLREENTPSFCVNLDKNVFKDFGDDRAKGSIITLVTLLNNCTFLEACYELERYKGQSNNLTFSFSGKAPSQAKEQATEPSIEIKDVRPLHHPALIRYCRERGISFTTAYQYLKEVHYRNNGADFFAVGFANDKGGYELRAKVGKEVKLCTSKALTTFKVSGSNAVNLFEGFFDFLSALEYYGVRRPTQTSVILNSTSLVSQALPFLRVGNVYTYLDNDEAGQKALAKLKRQYINVVNCSSLYSPLKDFNEFWQSLQTDAD